MKPKPSSATTQPDFFQTELKSIINLSHPPVKLAEEFHWDEFDQQLQATYAPVMGAPGINARLMVALHLLISPQPVFKYLTEHGARVEGEYLIIADWPVQFLPPAGPLVEEALVEAVEVEVEEIKTRVFTAEHLAAIALQTGRPKDKARLLQFIESGALSSERFQNILERHALAGSRRKFEQQFHES